MRGRVLLAGSVLAAIVVTVLTTVVLLLVEPTLSKAEAIKTGALAGGAVVALYALWLNDRRRRTEEARHELESEKADDERFARSVGLLGNEADQVRVGALHAFAWLADSTGGPAARPTPEPSRRSQQPRRAARDRARGSGGGRSERGAHGGGEGPELRTCWS